jgi:hypothetical protein
MATFKFSSNMYEGPGVLVYDPMNNGIEQCINKFIDTAFREANLKTARNRVSFVKGYVYTPSNEYNEIPSKFIRYKNYRR